MDYEVSSHSGGEDDSMNKEEFKQSIYEQMGKQMPANPLDKLGRKASSESEGSKGNPFDKFSATMIHQQEPTS